MFQDYKTFNTILYNTNVSIVQDWSLIVHCDKKHCTTQFKTFMNDVVRSLLKHCTTHCTKKYKLLYNIGQYVQYCTTILYISCGPQARNGSQCHWISGYRASWPGQEDFSFKSIEPHMIANCAD